MNISILILTKNEALDLPGCLSSVSWSDDIHVLDSCSSDSTAEVARAAGAHFTIRSFDGYASQRNAGLHGLKFLNSWVLILDADERVPEALRLEMLDFVSRPEKSERFFAARMRRKDIFLGRWLKHAQISPFFIRLVRPEKVFYEREINEVLKVDGNIYDLRSPFDHFPFSKGISHWIQKHNVYSTMEAEHIRLHSSNCANFSWIKAVFSADFNDRRIHQKGLFYQMPARPLIKWIYMMVIRRAFLDGVAGIRYATLQAIYEYFIVLKSDESLRSATTYGNIASTNPKNPVEHTSERN